MRRSADWFSASQELRSQARTHRREVLDDGQLCVMVMRKKGVPGFLAATARALVGWTRDDDMIRMDAVDRLRVESGRPRLTVSIDGETVSMTPPLDYRIHPGALRVIAPGRARPD